MKSILFIVDPLSTFKIYKATTFVMMREAQKRGYQIWACEPADISWESSRRVNSLMQQIHLNGNSDPWYDLIKTEQKNLADLQAVVMRKDPPFDSEYFYATHLLERAQTEGAHVFNNPRALRNHPEKLAIMEFSKWISPTLVTRRAQDVCDFHQSDP